MKTLFFECNMGAAGDMLMGALYELLDENSKNEFLEKMNHLHLPGVRISAAPAQKCGIWGTKMEVLVNGTSEGEELHDLSHHEHGQEHSHHGHSHHNHSHSHHHAGYNNILHQISHLPLPEQVRADASAVYRLIGEAEAKAHRTVLEEIHFHEVGTLDALADVAGVCLLIHMLSPEQILCSPIHTGTGTVRCAHGILPVPAPATAEILKGLPIYGGEVQGELCTPTGAALLKHFAADFQSMPPMTVKDTGYGMGQKDFPQANCVRAFFGDSLATGQTVPSSASGVFSECNDTILELTCTLDDMTGEALGFAMNALLAGGALDIYTCAAGMKKNRPGILLTCLCRPEQEETMTRLLFLHTTTRGIRVQECRRHVLETSYQKAATIYGDITVKTSFGYGVTRNKPEYEEAAKAAAEHGTDFAAVSRAAMSALEHS